MSTCFLQLKEPFPHIYHYIHKKPLNIWWICIYIMYIYIYYGYSWIMYTTIIDAYPHYEYIHISIYHYINIYIIYKYKYTHSCPYISPLPAPHCPRLTEPCRDFCWAPGWHAAAVVRSQVLEVSSGKLTKNDGKIHHFSWDNSLFNGDFP